MFSSVKPSNLLIPLLALVSSGASAQDDLLFEDNFDRPDSAVVGNGWTDSAGNEGGNLSIVDGRLTINVQDPEIDIVGSKAVYRPLPGELPLTITGTLTPGNGFGGLLLRYDGAISIFSDVDDPRSGYRIEFIRSDENIANSNVKLHDGAELLETIDMTTQFGPSLDVVVTFAADGLVSGSITQDSGDPEFFAFQPHQPTSSGENLMLTLDDPDPRGVPREDLTTGSWDDLQVFGQAATPGLVFPVCRFAEGAVACDSNAYTHPVTVIFDHAGDVPFVEDGIITAYNGVTAECANGAWRNDVRDDSACDDINGTDLLPGRFEYDLLQSDPFPEINYLAKINPGAEPGDVRASYDGHKGYDYRAAIGRPLVAAVDGYLCAVTGIAARPGGGLLWTNANRCPFATDPVNGGETYSGNRGRWQLFNTFYIVDVEGRVSAWYLHASALSTSVLNRISGAGFAPVVAGQYIGAAGDTGTPGAPHLHFNVLVDGVNQDPYGYAGSPVLWDERP